MCHLPPWTTFTVEEQSWHWTHQKSEVFLCVGPWTWRVCCTSELNSSGWARVSLGNSSHCVLTHPMILSHLPNVACLRPAVGKCSLWSDGESGAFSTFTSRTTEAQGWEGGESYQFLKLLPGSSTTSISLVKVSHMATAYFQVAGEVKSYRVPEGRDLVVIRLMALIATTA